jgi:uncharacterized membrane protein
MEREKRLNSLDALRGSVMILMALDHVRDFFHKGAMTFSPTDLTKTSVILFFTRWITHFCLPVFMFAAGASAFLWWRQGNRGKSELSRFLWTRGLWFIVLELTVMRLSYNFNFSPRFLFLLLILWIFGICLIGMAALIHLPIHWLLGVSLVIILFHNCLDGVAASTFGSGAWIWNLLHQPGVFPFAGETVLVTYTLIPWIAVMGAGFCFGEVLTWEASARRRFMLRAGYVFTTAFLLIRAVNLYGDPAPWSFQKSPVFTALSFLNCTKYPPSLDFLLMTLGPALLVLAYLDRRTLRAGNPLVVFGRVPLFYFVLHFYIIHVIAVLMAWLRYGKTAFVFMFNPMPTMGGPGQLFPKDFGYSLWVVYVVWLMVVLILYPLCKWFGKIRARRRDWWLSYL